MLNSDLIALTAYIDQVQGRWEKATAGLERAASLDPRNVELLDGLAFSFLGRLIDLEPNQRLVALEKRNPRFTSGRIWTVSALPMNRLSLL